MLFCFVLKRELTGVQEYGKISRGLARAVDWRRERIDVVRFVLILRALAILWFPLGQVMAWVRGDEAISICIIGVKCGF